MIRRATVPWWARWWPLAVFASCGSSIEASPSDRADPAAAAPLAPIKGGLCVTKGAAELGGTITEPTVRAVVRGSSGDAAALRFTYRGDTEKTAELATAGVRRQVGLKLRAQNGCNVVYVMWRLDPKPKLEVSIKTNPGMATHAECGARGYQKVKPHIPFGLPSLEIGATHTLRASIHGDDLTAWIDDVIAWRGTLPPVARQLAGPAGLRSDNLMFDLVSFEAAPGGSGEVPASCHREEGD